MTLELVLPILISERFYKTCRICSNPHDFIACQCSGWVMRTINGLVAIRDTIFLSWSAYLVSAPRHRSVCLPSLSQPIPQCCWDQGQNYPYQAWLMHKTSLWRDCLHQLYAVFLLLLRRTSFQWQHDLSLFCELTWHIKTPDTSHSLHKHA